MSDLQCPATLLVLGAAGWPSSPTSVMDRVACIYAHPSRRTEGWALARRFDAPLREDGLSCTAHGQWPPELSDIADQHRGETVIVLPAGPVRGHHLVRIDADGWSVSAWS